MPRSRHPDAPQQALFSQEDAIAADDLAGAPLAARMRPRSFEEFVDQDHLVAPGKLLRRLVEAGQLPSIILWGPPGSGKTTLARIIANQTSAPFLTPFVLSLSKDARWIAARVVRQAHHERIAPPVREPSSSSTRSTAS